MFSLLLEEFIFYFHLPNSVRVTYVKGKLSLHSIKVEVELTFNAATVNMPYSLKSNVFVNIFAFTEITYVAFTSRYGIFSPFGGP